MILPPFGKSQISVVTGYLYVRGLKRIWAATGKENTKAIQLLERVDFRKVADREDHEIEYELKRNR